jgi:hypothetical protein
VSSYSDPEPPRGSWIRQGYYVSADGAEGAGPRALVLASQERVRYEGWLKREAARAQAEADGELARPAPLPGPPRPSPRRATAGAVFWILVIVGVFFLVLCVSVFALPTLDPNAKRFPTSDGVGWGIVGVALFVAAAIRLSRRKK